MALFGKKKVSTPSCGCGDCCDVSTESIAKAQAMRGEGAAVKILGSGCKKCNELEANTKEALVRLGMDPTIDHVTDFAQISTFGIMTTPAIVVDGKVVSYGRVLKTDEVVKLLKKVRA